jgi:peptidyl-tRNA hydrolase
VAKEVPASFQDLKSKVKHRLQNGSSDIHSDIIEMGDAMLQSGVEPKSAQDRMAKHVWQAASPQQKRALANMVTDMAKEEHNLQ